MRKIRRLVPSDIKFLIYFIFVNTLFFLGNPNMYPTGAEEQTTESASRRADIPGQEDEELAKKQAVAYPYHYLYPGYTMAHGINPYYHFTPINYVRHIFSVTFS